MEKKSLVLVFSTALISGVSIYMNKFAVSGMDAVLFTFARAFIVSAALLAIISASSGFMEIRAFSFKEWLGLSAVGLVGGSIPFILFFRGLQLTSAASAALIHKTLFIFVAVLAILFLKERLSKMAVAASILLLTGNYFIIKPAFSINLGDMLVLGATILWAVENTLSKRILKKLSGNTVAFGRMFFGSFFLFLFLAITGKANLILSLSLPEIQWLLISSGMLLLYVFTWYNGLKHVNVSLATVILLLGAPITAILNFASGSALNLQQAGGIFLILLGVVGFINATPEFSFKELWTKKTRA